MDGGSKDVGSTPEEEIQKPQGIGRRSFLGKGLKLGTAGIFAATGGLGILGWLEGGKTKAASQSSNRQTATSAPSPLPTSTPTPERPEFEDPVEARVKQMTDEERDIYRSVVKNPIFANCTPLEKLVALDYVKPQVLYYKDETGAYKKRAEKTMRWSKSVETYYKVAIDEIIKYKEGLNPILTDPNFKDLILSLIFVESEGEADEIGADGDRGLCQLLPSTIQEIARRRGKSVDTADMIDPALNVRYAISHLNESLNNFKDLGIALWVYNLGHGNMINLFEAYFKGDRSDYYDRVTKVLNGEKLDEFEKPDPKTKKDNRPEPAKVIDHLGVDFITLINSNGVKKWLKERGEDPNPKKRIGKDTDKYVTRIAAAGYLIDFVKSKSKAARLRPVESTTNIVSNHKVPERHDA
ncbi:MAG: transglycosylase SLT domain-containing protein [Candidatus Levybacteria bacterium]|nr:transglycosylase SLT domain-containing protein [Candidatus Levybacteria bacterium]